MLANQPKNDTLYIKGFNIVVENRAFTYRQVAQNVGQKVCLMPAHYGYLQNNPKVGVFVGAFPENDTVYLINQKAQGGYFDKHIAMFGFLSEQQAVDTYQKCFEYGYIGLMSVVPCTIEQLKWWLANGDNSRPVTKERLPYAGLERLDSVLWGGEDKADLTSHGGQVSKLLYQIRQSDSFNHALEPLSYHDLTQELGNQGFVYENYDALVIEYNKLERKAKQLLMAMQGAADIVKPVGVAVSKPLNKGGVTNMVAWFEMDDGQAVGVFFHNPDKTPGKMKPTDEMISYKWVLNKKDITIVVAPENGKDLVVRTVAKRIMKLVDANHDRFLKANGAKAELNLREQDLGKLVIEKQIQLDVLNDEIKALEVRKGEKDYKTYSIEAFVENKHMIKDKRLGNSSRVSRTMEMKHWEEIARIVDTLDAAIDIFEGYSSYNKLRLVETYTGTVISQKNGKLDLDNKALEAQKAEKEAQPSGEQLLNTGYDGIKAELKGMAWVDDPIVQGGLVKSFIGAQESGDTNPDGISSISINRNGVNIAAKVGADTIIPNSVEIIPQYGLNVQSKENYKKIADKINNAVEAYVAKRRELVNTPRSSETQQPESEPPTVANGKIYDYIKEMGKPDGKVEFDDDYMVLLSIATRDINLPMEEFIDDEYDLEKISKRLTPHKEPLFKEAMANFKAKVNAEKVAAQNPDRDLLGYATIAALSIQTKQERDKKKSPDFVANTLAEKWTKALNGDSKAVKDIRDYFANSRRVPGMTKAHLIIFEGLTDQNFQGKTYEYVASKFDEYINTIAQPKEPVVSNPDRDFLQSIIDGKDTGLEPKAITAKIRTIISTAKDGNDTDMLSLADQAAKAYAAQVKAKAAAKLAEVQ